MIEKIKAEFGSFIPPKDCFYCKGRGEVKYEYNVGFFLGGHWNYKKCIECDGTGKNLLYCISCDELINTDFWCSNKNCKYYNIKVVLARKKRLKSN